MIWDKKPRRAYMEQLVMYERPGLIFSIILQNKTWASFVLEMDDTLIELRWNGNNFLEEDWPTAEKHRYEVHEILQFLFNSDSVFEFVDKYFPYGGCIYVENTNLIPAIPKYKECVEILNSPARASNTTVLNSQPNNS